MVSDAAESIKADAAESNILMPVFRGPHRILAVVEMNDRNLIDPDEPVKFMDDAVKMMYNIIAAVMDMAGVEADAKLLAVYDAVIDGS